jgi:diaminopimelate decarboxylase
MVQFFKTKLKETILKILHKKNEIDRGKKFYNNHLSPHLWDLEVRDNGHLFVAGCSLKDLAYKYGTPLYVIDKKRLEKNYFTFLNAFKSAYENVEIAYSYKTNPTPGVLKILHDVGANAEVISHFELWLALRLGVPGEKIVFNGPGKTKEAFESAFSHK